MMGQSLPPPKKRKAKLQSHSDVCGKLGRMARYNLIMSSLTKRNVDQPLFKVIGTRHISACIKTNHCQCNYYLPFQLKWTAEQIFHVLPGRENSKRQPSSKCHPPLFSWEARMLQTAKFESGSWYTENNFFKIRVKFPDWIVREKSDFSYSFMSYFCLCAVTRDCQFFSSQQTISKPNRKIYV